MSYECALPARTRASGATTSPIIDALLGCTCSRLIKPETQTVRILAGELLALPSARCGRLNDSTRINACAAALGFYGSSCG